MNRIFSDEDQLHLLQLMTRRNMAERARRYEERDGDDLDIYHEVVEPSVTDISRWRLIPEEISLYDWQQECMPRWMASGHGTIKVATGGG